MSSTKSIAQARHEAELATIFSKMTSTEISKMMNETENTFIKLTCFEYLKTL